MPISLARIDAAVEATGVPLTPRQAQVVALALLVAATPPPQPGLTPQVQAIIDALRAAKGRPLSVEALLRAGDCPTPNGLKSQLSLARRRCPDIMRHVQTLTRPHRWRWTGP